MVASAWNIEVAEVLPLRPNPRYCVVLHQQNCKITFFSDACVGWLRNILAIVPCCASTELESDL
jgi:hypothetical protein